jgi:hypothetical protein
MALQESVILRRREAPSRRTRGGDPCLLAAWISGGGFRASAGAAPALHRLAARAAAAGSRRAPVAPFRAWRWWGRAPSPPQTGKPTSQCHAGSAGVPTRVRPQPIARVVSELARLQSPTNHRFRRRPGSILPRFGRAGKWIPACAGIQAEGPDSHLEHDLADVLPRQQRLHCRSGFGQRKGPCDNWLQPPIFPPA